MVCDLFIESHIIVGKIGILLEQASLGHAPSEIGAAYLIAVGTERPFQTTVVETLKALSQRLFARTEERGDAGPPD